MNDIDMGSKRETPLTHCAAPDCPATFKSHAWGKIKADDWFHQRDGKSWCPNHHPEWVESWRKRQAEKGRMPGKYRR